MAAGTGKKRREKKKRSVARKLRKLERQANTQVSDASPVSDAHSRDPSRPPEPGEGVHAPTAHLKPANQDAAIERRALREGWAVPEEYRVPLVDRQVRIALDPVTSNKESTAAYRALLAGDMEQRSRDEGGQTLNVKLSAEVTDRRELIIRLRDELADFPEARAKLVALLRRRATQASEEKMNGIGP